MDIVLHGQFYMLKSFIKSNIKLDVIIQYIYYYITTNKLLRYAKFIEKNFKKI